MIWRFHHIAHLPFTYDHAMRCHGNTLLLFKVTLVLRDHKHQCMIIDHLWLSCNSFTRFALTTPVQSRAGNRTNKSKSTNIRSPIFQNTRPPCICCRPALDGYGYFMRSARSSAAIPRVSKLREDNSSPLRQLEEFRSTCGFSACPVWTVWFPDKAAIISCPFCSPPAPSRGSLMAALVGNGTVSSH